MGSGADGEVGGGGDVGLGVAVNGGNVGAGGDVGLGIAVNGDNVADGNTTTVGGFSTTAAVGLGVTAPKLDVGVNVTVGNRIEVAATVEVARKGTGGGTVELSWMIFASLLGVDGVR